MTDSQVLKFDGCLRWRRRSSDDGKMLTARARPRLGIPR